ncbi:ryncolin-1 [Stomoxys calcitrans]|uniref:Fibrinogen C-terminal domain-containing protein n=1 Tax=Stomoxys calcitrans TaxID=35570 RepID=A0A1I8QF03_STOCA|nr:ryncolin-1 [Stomoxys calcitrans]
MKSNLGIKSPAMGLLLILSLIQAAISTTTEATCRAQDDETIGQWFSQVSQYVVANQNTNQNVLQLQSKVDNLQRQLQELQQVVNDKSSSKDNEANGGDIVIQRRMDGSEDFYRNWNDFKVGFGNSSREFFIGLETLHKLTTSKPHQLLIIMEDWEGDRRLALYDFFSVGSEMQQYSLLSLGTYSGSAGDALSYHLGQKFSTKDRDNDVHNTNCAVDYTGAWWYKNCHHSNLNGRYMQGTTVEYAQGINWYQFKGHHYSLKFVEMILRPR